MSAAKKMAVHFSSVTTEWETPQELFDKLNAEFSFTLDVCATAQNAKCRMWFDEHVDGLKQDWLRSSGGGVAWCNPPYSDLRAWLEKGYVEAQRGLRSVFLIPARTDTEAFHRFILPFAGINSSSERYAWAAGIIDGEGCIFIRKNSPTETSRHRSPCHDLGVKVTMTHRETVERIATIFGVGTVTTDSNKPPGHKTSYSWTCRSSDAAMVLQAVYPFLVTKRHEAFRGIEFSLAKAARSGRERVPAEMLERREHSYAEMRDLKKCTDKGFVAPIIEIRFIRGRLKFGGHKNSAPFPSAIVVFGGRP